MVSRAALEIILQARDEASGIIDKATGMLSGLGGTAGAIATGGLAAAAAGVAAVGAGTVVVGKQVLDFSRDTSEAMRILQAQTGASTEEIKDFRKQAMDVYESGWGDNISDIADTMGVVNQALGEQGDQLEESTRRATVLRDTFAIDVAEGASIAATAVKSGLAETSEEAFDIITKGFQEGLNQGGDFGDTIREYSSDFERLGFEADEVLGVLNAGLEEGAYNTDVIADGIREFGIRFGGAEESAVQALDAIGLNSEELYAQYESGEITVADAMATITGALSEVDSQTARAQAGAALFGSKWEDVGGQVFVAAGQAQGAIDGVAGATDQAGEALNQGFGAAVERLKRTVVTNLSPLGDVVVETMNKAAPHLDKASAWLGEKIPEALEWLDEKWNSVFPKAKKAVEDFWTGIKPGILWVEYYFKQFTDAILPHLESAWESLKQGWMIIKTVIDRDLKPALQELFDALGIGGDDVGELSAKFGDFVGFLIDTGVKALILGIAAAIQVIANHAESAKKIIDGFKAGLDGVKSAARWVVDQIDRLGNAFTSLKIPDWLTPGSPTPFEMGLRGIADAMDDLPDMQSQFSVSGQVGRPEAGSLAVQGAGGPMYNINLNFGPGSVRSDDDIEEIARRQEEILAVRGVRRWDI